MHASDVSATAVASQAKSDRRMASIDGLRGIAALSVFVFHGWLYTMPEPGASHRSSVGDYVAHELRLGLVLFFVLSGFLLSRPWFAAALDERRPPDLRRYLRARLARIAPAYYVALVGSIGLLWGLSGTPGLRLPPASELPLFFVFAQNTSPSSVMKLNPPLWSLAVEVGFYALLPVIGWLAVRLPSRQRAQALIPLALLALGIGWNWWTSGLGMGMTFSKTLVAMLPYFALGMLAALTLHGRRPGRTTRRAMIVTGLTCVVADASAKAALAAAGIGTADATTYLLVMRDVLSATGFALMIAATAAAPRQRLLGSRPLAAMGTISYGFYLWHVPVLMFLRGHGLLPLDPLLGMLVAIGPALAVSALSWFALERPIIAWAARRNERARAQRRQPAPRWTSGGGGVDRRAGHREVGTVRV
ncbi:MAG TPA: acyltransferase [Solirubrobacteraceae bacterium]|jgi:peptidoglycan/LPS O-acetylase OafA/YrhL|nr:acyltransferase [Solirubrobacteraceae bacterium]